MVVGRKAPLRFGVRSSLDDASQLRFAGEHVTRQQIAALGSWVCFAKNTPRVQVLCSKGVNDGVQGWSERELMLYMLRC